MQKTLIIIPSRLAATRLPGKPLLKINGISIIAHVYKKALECNLGEVFVATEDQEILDDIKSNGGEALLTKKAKTGTDRVLEAFKKLNRSDVDYILNIQGDEPMISTNDIINLNINTLKNNSEMGSLGCKIKNNEQLNDESIVKVKTLKKIEDNSVSEALGFFRKTDDFKNQNIYHHIGVYQYKIEILKKFVSFEQTENEKKYKLEQLRALENNIQIDISLAKSSPIGVDTKEDFEKVRNLLEIKK